jgi:hypothetical protein
MPESENKKGDKNNENDWSFEEEQNLLGLLSLLLEADKKQNPHLYRKPKNEGSKVNEADKK